MKNIKEKKGWIVGVDVGGTFTDFCARENISGKTVIHKRPSTPSDPSLGIVKGLDELKSKISGQSELLERNESIKESIALREETVLPLLVIQQYALMKLKENDLKDEQKETLEKITIRFLFGNINASRNSA